MFVIPTIIFTIAGIAALLAMPRACSYLDRYVGSGHDGRLKPVGLGTAIFAGTALAMGLWGWSAALFALGFWAWRTPGFGHNVITPTNAEERKATFIRHFGYSLPMFIPAAFLAGAPLWLLPWIVVCFWWFGTQAVKYGVENAKTLTDSIDRNTWVEEARGKAFGIAVAAAFIPLVICTQLDLNVKNRPEMVATFIKEGPKAVVFQ